MRKYEARIEIKISELDTEEEAAAMSTQVAEIVHEVLTDSDLPVGDLAVSTFPVTVYDPATGADT